MDGSRFDDLTRRLAAGASRRAFLKGVAGGLVAGLVGSRGTSAAAGLAIRQANGAACSRVTDCASLRCVDGVCCDSPCLGQCEACNLPGSEGTCLPVSGAPVGSRPACSGSGPCAAVCDGQTPSHCAAFPGPEVACGDSSCVDGAQTGFACAGNGSCAATTASCGLFVCDAAGIACLSTCEANDDCIGQAHCADGVCQGDRGLGEPCASADECQSGFCAGGVCCIEPCGQPCHACNLPGAAGFCEPVADETSCGSGLCCDGGCIDPTTDPEHCGGCDAGCIGGHVCDSAECVCPDGATSCQGQCVPNCVGDQFLDLGSCECTCPNGTSACGGQCVADCPLARPLNPTSCQCECPPGAAECPDGSCVEIGTNQHCLACDDACGPLEVCAGLGTGCCTQVGQVCDLDDDDCCRSLGGDGGCVEFNGGTICCDATFPSPCHPDCTPGEPCAACCAGFCDPNNRCNNPPPCPDGATRCGGVCVDACTAGQTLNPDSCTCEETTCKAAGETCSGATSEGNAECCSEGCGCDGVDCTCRQFACRPLGQSLSGQCPVLLACCAGTCIFNPFFGFNVCACGFGVTECNGRCLPNCPTGQLMNLDTCECEEAVCIPLHGDCSPSGAPCCDGSCDFDFPTNSGACACEAGTTECNGQCIPDCPEGQTMNLDTCECELGECIEFLQICTPGGTPCCGANVECRRPVPVVPISACLCPADQPVPCDDACVNLATDEEHCGACNNQCESDETCCFGECVNLANNDDHCGACGVSCGEDHNCNVGACCGFAGTSCQVDDDCCGAVQAFQACCNNICTAITIEEDHCGACNNACDSDQVCVQASCCGAGGSACQVDDDCCAPGVCTGNQCQ